MSLASINVAQLTLYHVTGPDGQPIEISPDSVVSIRPPRNTDHFAKGTNCLIFTNDGKYTAVVETCPLVQLIMTGHLPQTSPPGAPTPVPPPQ